ncbi:hypothetical protein CYLTODRAFT_414019 [Cylindrobasidium torrendii FP15055 ss-10]|uniref:Uncharacterized protein n=1 Tax=Cylindrobasidium torrendii FP15055 ss-10 TaxID=1314674 RepID=A0A0D7AZ03_9AGAR|nr:hypothetical protein CYLTODRAFT_414019 [Cylindrobasidium torrendii FP15055 ss-10]
MKAMAMPEMLYGIMSAIFGLFMAHLANAFTLIAVYHIGVCPVFPNNTQSDEPCAPKISEELSDPEQHCTGFIPRSKCPEPENWPKGRRIPADKTRRALEYAEIRLDQSERQNIRFRGSLAKYEDALIAFKEQRENDTELLKTREELERQLKVSREIETAANSQRMANAAKIRTLQAALADRPSQKNLNMFIEETRSTLHQIREETRLALEELATIQTSLKYEHLEKIKIMKSDRDVAKLQRNAANAGTRMAVNCINQIHRLVNLKQWEYIQKGMATQPVVTNCYTGLPDYSWLDRNKPQIQRKPLLPKAIQVMHQNRANPVTIKPRKVILSEETYLLLPLTDVLWPKTEKT